MLLTDKVRFISHATLMCFHPNSDACPQRDIRLERNDIIALVNTLQQVRICPRCLCVFFLHGRSSFVHNGVFSFPKLFASAAGCLQ